VLLKEWSEEKRKRIYPLMIDGQDELNPLNEPNQALDGSLGREKLVPTPERSSRALWFGAKIVPPRTPSIKPLGPI
jgi:hypothetical protein